MKRLNKWTLLCVLLISIPCLTKTLAYSQDLETVKVSIKPFIGQSPVVIASEEGFFKEEGINVEFIKANNSSDIWLLLVGGAVDVMLAAPAAAIYTVAGSNKNIKLVAGSNYLAAGNKGEVLAIRRSSNRKSDVSFLVKSLKNKKVGIPQLGSLSNYFLNELLKRNGIFDKDIKLSITPYHSIVQVLQTGILDAGILTEPFTTLLRDKNQDTMSFVSFGDIFPNTPFIFMVYGQKLLVKKPDLGVRFMIAYLKGCAKYNEGKTERNIEIIQKLTGLDKEMLRAIEWPVVSPEGIFSSARILEDYQNWLFDKAFIDKKVSADSLTDTSFLEQAKKVLK